MSAHPVDIHVGMKLRQRRQLLHLSQGDLAEAIGITFQQIQKYESGANRTSASRLFEFARLLKLPSVNYFFEGLDFNERSQNRGVAEGAAFDFEHENINSKEVIELNRTFLKLRDPKKRKTAVKMFKDIIEGFLS